MKITVFGAGYVGLVTSTCLAEMGNRVTCIDINENKIKELNDLKIPIFEPGLSELINSNLNNRLFFSTDVALNISNCDIIFLAVGTPEDEKGNPVLDNLFSVANSIGKDVGKDCVIVQKSTAPVGTCSKVKSIVDGYLESRQLDYNIEVVSNPEFLKEGNAVNDFMSPDRIIIGSDSKNATQILKELYKAITTNALYNFAEFAIET